MASIGYAIAWKGCTLGSTSICITSQVHKHRQSQLSLWTLGTDFIYFIQHSNKTSKTFSHFKPPWKPTHKFYC
jgi:hypothetical protein